jgi:CBS domain-containing protein
LKDAARANGHGVYSVAPTVSIRGAAEILAKNKVGILIVEDDRNKLIDVLSERDVVRALGTGEEKNLDANVEAFITRDVKTCRGEHLFIDAMELMSSGGFRHMPVVTGEKCADMLSSRDLAHYITSYASPEEQAALWTKISWV